MATSNHPNSAGTTDGAASAARAVTKVTKLPPWNVVLLNDDDHSFAYVIEMLGVVASIAPERAMQMAKEVDTSGRVIVLTTHREKAELKQEEIHAYGVDLRTSQCKGSMSALIEPAEG